MRDLLRQMDGIKPTFVKGCIPLAQDDMAWWLAQPTMPFHKVVADEEGGERFVHTTLSFATSKPELEAILQVQRRLVEKIVCAIDALPKDVKAWLRKESATAQDKKERAKVSRARQRERGRASAMEASAGAGGEADGGSE